MHRATVSTTAAVVVVVVVAAVVFAAEKSPIEPKWNRIALNSIELQRKLCVQSARITARISTAC